MQRQNVRLCDVFAWVLDHLQEARRVSLGIVVTFLVRLALVALFLPFSALDKVLNFRGAVWQASEVSVVLAPILVLGGLGVEILASLGILTGIADRLAAFVLSGYCGLAALLWKRFWTHGDFWSGGHDRELFWDFLKNVALGAGILFITFGTGPADVPVFFERPLSSSRPYFP
jgi:putative oxidoreductase